MIKNKYDREETIIITYIDGVTTIEVKKEKEI